MEWYREADIQATLSMAFPRRGTRNEEFLYEEFLTRKTDEENEELTELKYR